MQPATIHSALAAKIFAGDLLQYLEYRRNSIGLLLQEGTQRPVRVEQQIQIGRHGLRLIPNEPERPSLPRAAAHVCAEEWRRFTLLLPIPRRALSNEVAFTHTTCRCCLQIRPKRRVLRLDRSLAEITVDERKLRLKHGIAITIRFNDRAAETPNTRQNRLQIPLGQISSVSLLARKDEERVVARRDTALNAEEVSEQQTGRRGYQRVVSWSRRWICGPLMRMAQSPQRYIFGD